MASADDTEERLRTALADRYLIEREIGVGGMATVYLAMDLKHERQVAVKVLDPGLAQSLGASRFLREIKTAANLNHPHILPLHDSGDAGGLLFYVMPYVKGESLRDRLAREKQLPVEEAIQITREIADALAYAHREGVIHRDVKPGNIMLDEGHAVLTDFGVAQAVAEARDDRLTRTGTSLGTPAYMSPEQAAGETELDGRSDQYALGCVLYEMLAGHPPFTGAQVEAVVRQHLTEQPPSVTRARPAVPEELTRVIDKALSKSPADRFKTTGEMAAALAHPATPVGRRRSKVLNPVRMGVVASAFVLIGAGAYFAFFRGSEDPVASWGAVAEAASEPTVAVFPFENLIADTALSDLGRIAQTQIAAALSWIDEIVAISPSTVAQARGAQPETVTDQQIAASLGATIMVTGSIASLADELQLHAQTSMVNTGETAPVIEVSGLRGEPMAAVEELRQRVMGGIAASAETDLEPDFRGITLRTPSYDALRAFILGVDQGFDYANAIRHFNEAYALDQDFLTPLVLASFYAVLQNRLPVADSLLGVLESRRAEISPDERLWLDFLDAWIRSDWDAQLTPLRALARRDPLAWFFLANAAVNAGRPAEALEADDQIRGGPEPEGPGGAWLRTRANHLLGHHEEVLRIAREGREDYPADLFLRYQEIRALVVLGRFDEAGSLLDEIEGMEPSRYGSGSYSPGGVFYLVASDLARFGPSEAAEGMAERGINWYRARNAEAYRLSISKALILLRRSQDALDLLETLAQEDPENVDVRGTLGVAMALSGDRAGALREDTWLGQVDRAYVRGENTYWRATILAHLGQQEEAVQLLRQAYHEGYSLRMGSASHPLLWPLWDYPAYERLFEPRG